MTRNINGKWIAFLLALIGGGLMLFAPTPIPAQAQSNDPFIYPKHGQVLIHGNGYMVKARPINGATHHLVRMYYGGVSYSNHQDAGNWSTSLNLFPDHPKHSQFKINQQMYIGVRGYVNGRWTPENRILVMLTAPDVANMISHIKVDLNSRTNTNPVIMSVTPKRWPNSHLGCSTGGVSTPVIVDGYRIQFRDYNSVNYNYHTRGTSFFKLCPY